MATNNQINSGLVGVTGTGSIVGNSTPTLITPTLGAATATSFDPANDTGIIGTTTNDDAAAGSVGEYLSSSVLTGSSITLTSTVVSDITSIALTAGDWYLTASVSFDNQTGADLTFRRMGISTVSATIPTDIALNNTLIISDDLVAGNGASFVCSGLHASLSGTTTYYLVASATFASGVSKVFGFIGARRVR